jgi:DNA replication and repair protein RecF
MVGLASSVLFTADDIRLVHGSPDVRRRFLDILMSQVDRQYLRSLQRYLRVVSQRNRLLKLLREGRASPDEAAFWNDELVKEGAFIMRRRTEALDSISILTRERHRRLTGGKEILEVRYAPSTPLDRPENAEQALEAGLEATRSRERALAVTLVGPHRDDFRLLVGGIDMASYASRGQARTIGLALRLSEATYLADLKGEDPILLLDDVLSELDATRRQQVLEAALVQEQALITTTDLSAVEGSLLEHASLLRAQGGMVGPSGVILRRRPRE